MWQELKAVTFSKGFVPASKGLLLIFSFCGISKDREALSSPEAHQKQSWFSGGEQGSVLHHIPSPSTANWHRTKRIQNSEHPFLFCFILFFFLLWCFPPFVSDPSPSQD